MNNREVTDEISESVQYSKNEATDKFSKFMWWVLISSISVIMALFFLSSIDPYDMYFTGNFTSFSGFLGFIIALIIPLFIFTFVLFFIMLMLHDRLRRLFWLYKIIYYLLISGGLALLLHYVWKPDWYVFYVCALIPPFLFGIVLEKGWLK